MGDSLHHNRSKKSASAIKVVFCRMLFCMMLVSVLSGCGRVEDELKSNAPDLQMEDDVFVADETDDSEVIEEESEEEIISIDSEKAAREQNSNHWFMKYENAGYLFYDIDNDGSDEKVVFYPKDTNGFRYIDGIYGTGAESDIEYELRIISMHDFPILGEHCLVREYQTHGLGDSASYSLMSLDKESQIIKYDGPIIYYHAYPLWVAAEHYADLNFGKKEYSRVGAHFTFDMQDDHSLFKKITREEFTAIFEEWFGSSLFELDPENYFYIVSAEVDRLTVEEADIEAYFDLIIDWYPEYNQYASYHIEDVSSLPDEYPWNDILGEDFYLFLNQEDEGILLYYGNEYWAGDIWQITRLNPEKVALLSELEPFEVKEY